MRVTVILTRRIVFVLFVLAAVFCGDAGVSGDVIFDDEDIVSAHISRIVSGFGSRFYIFYKYAATAPQAIKFCNDTGGALAGISLLSGLNFVTNQAIISFFNKSSSTQNDYLWVNGKCCEQSCVDDLYFGADEVFEQANRVFMPSAGDACVYRAWRPSSQKLRYLPHDSQLAPEFACYYASEDVASCAERSGHPQVDRLRDSRGICVLQTNITDFGCICFDTDDVSCTELMVERDEFVYGGCGAFSQQPSTASTRQQFTGQETSVSSANPSLNPVATATPPDDTVMTSSATTVAPRSDEAIDEGQAAAWLQRHLPLIIGVSVAASLAVFAGMLAVAYHKRRRQSKADVTANESPPVAQVSSVRAPQSETSNASLYSVYEDSDDSY